MRKEDIEKIMKAGIKQIFICEKCKKRVKYIQGVNKHIKENPTHCQYNLEGTDSCLFYA